MSTVPFKNWCVVALLVAGSSGCFIHPEPKKPEAPPEAAYEPNFSYQASASKKKLDVTIGVISPQFSVGARMYQEASKEDDVVKAMLSAMAATFNEVLIAKGFNTKGPFVSLNDMTFPEKKGSDLLLYPEFDFQVQVKIDNQREAAVDEAPADDNKKTSLADLLLVTRAKPANKRPEPPRPTVCDAVLTVSGNILFVAQEPLSGERMWIKRLDVAKAKQTFNGQRGVFCSTGQPGPGHWTLQIKNAWAKTHEALYQEGMKSFDNYVNGEEFQMLKRQSQELRAKKSY